MRLPRTSSPHGRGRGATAARGIRGSPASEKGELGLDDEREREKRMKRERMKEKEKGKRRTQNKGERVGWDNTVRSPGKGACCWGNPQSL